MGGFWADMGRSNHEDLHFVIYLSDSGINTDYFPTKFARVSRLGLSNTFSDKWNNLILLF